ARASTQRPPNKLRFSNDERSNQIAAVFGSSAVHERQRGSDIVTREGEIGHLPSLGPTTDRVEAVERDAACRAPLAAVFRPRSASLDWAPAPGKCSEPPGFARILSVVLESRPAQMARVDG